MCFSFFSKYLCNSNFLTLVNLFSNEVFQQEIDECNYIDIQDDKELNYNTEKLIESIKEIQFNLKNPKEQKTERILQKSINELVTIFMYFKHKSFETENEIRLIVHTPNGQAINNVEIIGNKPRIAVQFNNNKTIREFIKEVKVSPHGNVPQNKLLAAILVNRYKLSDKITISQSNIPYINI